MGTSKLGKNFQLTNVVYAQRLAPPTTKFSPESLSTTIPLLPAVVVVVCSTVLISKYCSLNTNRIRRACIANKPELYTMHLSYQAKK